MRVQALKYGDYGDLAKMTDTKMAFASRPSVPFVSLASHVRNVRDVHGVRTSVCPRILLPH